MPLDKQVVTLNFAKGLDLKTDKNQIAFGKFLSLQNSVFDTLAQLTKRNGFGKLTSTIGSISYLTSFQENLIGIGTSIQSYSNSLKRVVGKGNFPNVSLGTVPLVNTLYGSTQVDTAISNGLICAAYTNLGSASYLSGVNASLIWQFSIIEQETGQLLSGPTLLPISSGTLQRFSPRTFAVGSSFFCVYDSYIPGSVGSNSSLQFVTIPMSSPFTVSSISVISSQAGLHSSLSFDGVISSSNTLLMFWNISYFGGQGVDSRIINANGSQNTIINSLPPSGVAPAGGAILSATVDTSRPQSLASTTVWFGVASAGSIVSGNSAYLPTDWQGVPKNSFAFQVGNGSEIQNPRTQITNISLFAQNGTLTSFIEYFSAYSYDLNIKTNLINKVSVADQTTTISLGSLSSVTQVARGVGLASKAFIVNSTGYFLSTYSSQYQSTYFLLNSTGSVQAKVAYGNGGGYLSTGLPSVTVIGSSSYIPYLIKNTISPVGKLTNTSSQTGIFSSLGINLGQFNFKSNLIQSKEIGQNLILNGGFLGAYDGQQFTENNFFLYPDNVEVGSIGAVGSVSITGPGANTYSYAVTYEWPDYKANIFRSAPSIPVTYVAGTQTNFLSVSVPTLRLSYKNFPYNTGLPATPVKISIYRWSLSQPIYYFVSQIVQDASMTYFDSISYNDSALDSQILGNQILYTNGGVVEDSNGPACTAMTTFDSRLWLIDAEDQNLLWFSKQVIENTPVEMSDLFTFYVAPNIGAEGPTGNMKCLAPMDDRLVIFKKSALYYINGVGPDNTGASNQYSEPIFITSAVGSDNPQSIVLIPQGLMFQSDKGIWLLKRDLSTAYIGQDVESITLTARVVSTLTVPNTNQVRLTLNTGVVLLYDYFVNQWGTFSGIPGISSTLYQGLHTYVNSSSSIFQETPGLYFDGSIPTTMSFTTGFLSLAGLQGYQRIYRSYLLGSFYSPHNFQVKIGYDYNPSIFQTINVNPTNSVGSGSQVEQWRLNFQNQSCQSFQVTFTEVSSQSAGQGLTLSGLQMVYGVDKQFPRNLGAGNTAG